MAVLLKIFLSVLIGAICGAIICIAFFFVGDWLDPNTGGPFIPSSDLTPLIISAGTVLGSIGGGVLGLIVGIIIAIVKRDKNEVPNK